MSTEVQLSLPRHLTEALILTLMEKIEVLERNQEKNMIESYVTSAIMRYYSEKYPQEHMELFKNIATQDVILTTIDHIEECGKSLGLLSMAKKFAGVINDNMLGSDADYIDVGIERQDIIEHLKGF